ncbi:MAG: biotin/lipoyl-binding protein [Bilophila wadsworthia]
MTTDENLSMTPDNDKDPQRRKRPRKGPIVGILLLLFLLAGIGAGAWWYLFLRFEESTDDAYVAGNVLRIMPQVSGKVVAVDVDDNDMVAAGQTLVRLDPVDARLAYERSSWRWLPPCATTAAFRLSSGKPRPPSGCAGWICARKPTT